MEAVLQEQLSEKAGRLFRMKATVLVFTPVGTAVITGAGKLTARFVIHTVVTENG